MLAWAGGSPSWMISFFYPLLQPPPTPALSSGHLPGSDFHEWGLWRKKKHNPTEEWFGVMDGGNTSWDTGRSHVSIFKGLDGVFHGCRCAPLAQTHSSSDTPPGFSISSAFTFLTKSIQNYAFLHLPVWAVTLATKVVLFKCSLYNIDSKLQSSVHNKVLVRIGKRECA